MLFRPLVLALSVMPAAADDAFDLSLPFVQRPEYNNQTTFLDDVAQISGIKTAMLLYDSEVVFDYARADTESDGGLDSLQIQWSVTKTWSSFLIGVLIDEGYLASEHVTLEEIFTDSDYYWTWFWVSNAAAKKTITVQELLTQTAGYWWCWWEWHANPDSLLQALNFCWDSGTRGSFSYANPSILAYILYELTGETPLEFAESTGVFAALGIAPGDLTWDQNAEGIEMFGYGMYASAVQMAKLGQLYMQHGKSGDAQVVSRAWVSRSQSPHVWSGDGHYGYLWWVQGSSPPYNSTYSAIGNDGQYVTLFQEHGAVLACTSDSYDAADTLTELVEEYFLEGDYVWFPDPEPEPEPPTPAPTPRLTAPTSRPTPRPTPRPRPAESSASTGSSSAQSSSIMLWVLLSVGVVLVVLLSFLGCLVCYLRQAKQRNAPAPGNTIEMPTLVAVPTSASPAPTPIDAEVWASLPDDIKAEQLASGRGPAF